ncbi:hypothetical protein BjapCC829_07070 [Bradyrhizobium barranii]|uniref:Uncharacterized protein n=1 Tax=Bradyrhizobium barranii TaxID=2992140 RepID=A0ABY3QRE4_9BRAD|nr:hypothetical protein [Bradyrhizobium japonicum]UFW88325.1 hypothetical protein BjapCC829_07070 [Bradyrhizobium japonicum]
MLVIQCTASKPGKQSLEIRPLSRSPYHIDPFLDNHVGGRACKSEGVHIGFVLL